MEMGLVGVVTQDEASEWADLHVLLLGGEKVPGFCADLGLGQGGLGVLHNQLRHPVLAPVVIDDVEWAELPQGDGTWTRNELAGRIAGGQEDAQWQTRK